MEQSKLHLLQSIVITSAIFTVTLLQLKITFEKLNNINKFSIKLF